MQKRAKQSAKSIYKANKDKTGRHTRFQRVLTQAAELWAFRLQQLRAPLKPGPRLAPGAAPPGSGGGSVDWVELGGDLACKPGEFWLVRFPEADVMRFWIGRVESLRQAAHAPGERARFLARVRLYEEGAREESGRLPRLQRVQAGHAGEAVREVDVREFVEQCHVLRPVGGRNAGHELCRLPLARPRTARIREERLSDESEGPESEGGDSHPDAGEGDDSADSDWTPGERMPQARPRRRPSVAA